MKCSFVEIQVKYLGLKVFNSFWFIVVNFRFICWQLALTVSNINKQLFFLRLCFFFNLVAQIAFKNIVLKVVLILSVSLNKNKTIYSETSQFQKPLGQFTKRSPYLKENL